MICIIPCAGFGKRMGMKKNQSKEMLPDTDFKNDHIIDYSINICRTLEIEPIVVTRKEKKDLINYLKEKKVKYIIFNPNEHNEWYDSVLASQAHWDEDNLLILPDTRFLPIFPTISDIKKGLELGNEAVFAVHKVNDPQNWGIIKDYSLFEKPENMEGPQRAWGLIGFKKSYGFNLFSRMKMKNQELEHAGFVYLNSFLDITRGK